MTKQQIDATFQRLEDKQVALTRSRLDMALGELREGIQYLAQDKRGASTACLKRVERMLEAILEGKAP